MQLGYAFDNAHDATVDRFDALARLFDARSIANLASVGIERGWSCLDAGAGGGSIAAWLCAQVGPCGRVTATDINTRFLDSIQRPNLQVQRHDIVRDPLPQAAFDLVHTRLVLVVLADREKPLANMLAALRPGGWLVAEEFDSISLPAIPSSVERTLKSVSAMQQLLISSGANLQFGRQLAGRLRELGCVDIAAEGHVSIWSGGSPGASLLGANITQLRDQMIENGLIRASELESDLAELGNPDAWFLSPTLWSVRARRPMI